MPKLEERIEAYIKAYQKLPHGHEVEGTVELLEECKNAIRMCTARPHRWIPVEERLPEDEGTLVLVQLSGRPDTNVTLIDSIELATYCEGGWILKGWFQWDEAKPVAWMPLPEPYRQEEAVDGRADQHKGG